MLALCASFADIARRCWIAGRSGGRARAEHLEARAVSSACPQYKVEYRERPEGALLKSNFVTASNAEAAETEVKRAFTAAQANRGARQYQILDAAALVVVAHFTPDDPPRENLTLSLRAARPCVRYRALSFR